MPSSLLKFAWRATALALVLGGTCALLAKLWTDAATLPAAAWATSIAVAGALLGRLAGLLVPGGRPESPAQAALLGIGVRLITTAGGCLAAVSLEVSPLPTFVATVLVQYLALLVLEVGQAVAEVRSAESAAADRHGGGAAS